MINRQNYLGVREYLHYHRDVLQHDPETVRRTKSWLHLLLKWADDTGFDDGPAIRPVFPQYLVSVARGDRPVEKLSRGGVSRTCQTARTFFEWLRIAYPRQYSKLSDAWVRTIQPPRMADEPGKEHEAVSVDIVQKLIAVPDNGNLRVKRDKAAAALLFLSGMRATAFCTLPLSCVNIAAHTITQYPSEGVLTKNRKAAITHLLDIPDLLEFIAEWDAFIRTVLPPTGLWYPVLSGSFGALEIVNKEPGSHRSEALRKNMRRLFDLSGQPRMSPHKFRHGHAVYGLKGALDVSDLKAVSMNLMHSSIGITDSIYAVLSNQDVGERIAGLWKSSDVPAKNKDAIAESLRLIAAQLESE